MKNIKYTIGLILIALAFITGVISPFFLVIAVPVFIIGAVLIFVSKKQTKTKLLSVIIPAVLYFPVAGTFIYFYNKTTPETYLIPEDFRGSFRVVYGEECGVEPKEENGRRVLEIPSSGILIVKPEYEAGIIDHQYYLLDKNGRRIRVPEYIDFLDSAKTKFGVDLLGTGAFGGEIAPGSFSSESPLAIHYMDFYFLIPSDTTTNIGNEGLDSLTKAMVENCRIKK